MAAPQQTLAMLGYWSPRWRPYNITESRGSHDPRLLLFGADMALLPFKGRYRSLEKAQSANLAFSNSRLRRAMLLRGTFLGHSAAHAPVLVQLPKPSSSILRTMARAQACTFGMSLGKECKLADLGTYEEHGRAVFASGHTCAATDAGGGVHGHVGDFLAMGMLLASGAPPQLNDT